MLYPFGRFLYWGLFKIQWYAGSDASLFGLLPSSSWCSFCAVHCGAVPFGLQSWWGKIHGNTIASGCPSKTGAYLLEMVLGITYSLPCCQSLRIALLPGIYRFLLAPDSARYLSADAKKFLVDKGIRLRLEWSYCCCFFFLFQCDIDMITVWDRIHYENWKCIEILPLGDGKPLSTGRFIPSFRGFSRIQGFGYGTKTIARAMERIRSGTSWAVI